MSNHDKIAAKLGSEILKGTYPQGGKMPAEPDLIRRFRVSRTVMREVMKTLAAKGFVVSKTRIGTTVRDSVHWNFFDAHVLAWRVSLGLDDDIMRSLTEIRRALEPAAAALAAERRTTLDVALLRRHVSDMARGDHSRKSFAASDLAFHLAVGVASGNPLIRSIGSVIEAALAASFSHSSPIDEAKDQDSSVRSHAAIVDAIDLHDAKAAANAMLAVIDAGVTRISAKKKQSAKSRGRKP